MNKKLLLVKIMKITFLQLTFFLVLMGNAIAYKGSAQGVLDTKITINKTNTELKLVLKDIEDKYNVSFMYSAVLIDPDRKVSIAATEQPLWGVLNQMLPLLKISYEYSGNVVVLKQNSEVAMNSEQSKDITVNGKVTDNKGVLLPGVSIKIKGSTGGVSTDVNGKYQITVPDANSVLVFSYIGFVQKEKTIGNLRTIDVVLEPADMTLDEVVVVGYGTQKKVNLTGAVASVTGEELNKRVVTNTASLLQGKLPGLTVIENSGEPGNEGISLRIRGSGTFSGAGNDPLVVIDGIPGNLNSLNPNDIENISMLKDAASASIYGTRAANGVILVTTKKGKEGKMNLEYSYNAGITSATRLLDLVTNSVEYMEMYNKAAARQGLTNLYTPAFIDLYRNPTDPAKYGNVDWQDLLFSTIVTHNHYLTANGGRNGTRYNVGLGFIDQPGVMDGFEYKKYTLQVGLNSVINKSANFGINLNFNYADRKYPRQGAGEQYLAAVTQPPMFGPYLPDGTGRFTETNKSDPTGQFHNKNPFAVSKYVRAIERPNNLIANMFLKVNVLENLLWETRGGLNFGFSKTNDFRPLVNTYNYYNGLPGTLDVGALGLNVTDNSSINPIIYTQLTYDKKFGSHSLTVMGGAQAEYNKSENLTGFKRGFLDNELRELNGGGADGQTSGGSASESTLQSLYGRLNYNFNQKYLLEANVRYDGSSRFAPGNQWALFPSFSAGWRVSQESFLKNLEMNWLSELKFRGSWGRLGNQNIGVYPYQANLNTGSVYPLDNSGNLTTGVTYPSLVDNSIRWETTQMTDLGFDAGFFDNKLTLTVDWFNKETFDILRGAQISAYKGLNAPTINFGKMQNKGWDINAQYNDRIGDFSYGIGAAYQTVSNKLIKYGAKIINSATIIEEGRPYNEFYLYDWIGIFQSQAEITASPKQPNSPKPGDLKFRDVNNDGAITAADRTYMDGAYAKFNYSFNFNLGYKQFDLTTFLYGVHGQKQYVATFGLEPFTQGQPPLVEWRNAWTPENQSTTMPAIYVTPYAAVGQLPSSYFLKTASFLRIKNVQLGYNVPARLSKKVGINDLRVYFSGDNLAVFSKYPHLDPERSPQSGTGSRFLNYPQNRILSFGTRVKF